jgi:hypothetical protein
MGTSLRPLCGSSIPARARSGVALLPSTNHVSPALQWPLNSMTHRVQSVFMAGYGFRCLGCCLGWCWAVCKRQWLDAEEQLSNQLESLPFLVRFQYDKSRCVTLFVMFVCSFAKQLFAS